MIKNVFLILVSIAVIFVYIRYIEKRSLYIPYKDIERTPGDIGLEYKDLMIMASDGTMVNAWWVPSQQGGSTLFFLHGNGGNLSHRLEKIAFFHKLGLDVFIIDYRGYGRSNGIPSENGLYADAQGAYDYMTQKLKVPEEHIIFYGESLGSAVAIDLATKRKARALITEGAFTSTAEIARRFYPFLPTFFLSARFDSLSKVPNIKIPKLMIHSRNDEIVPYALGKKLFDAASVPKDFLTVDGGHNECFYLSEGQIEKKIKRFIEEL